MEGKILAANYARNNKKPYLGICLGMQIAVSRVCGVFKGCYVMLYSFGLACNNKKPYLGIYLETDCSE